MDDTKNTRALSVSIELSKDKESKTFQSSDSRTCTTAAGQQQESLVSTFLFEQPCSNMRQFQLNFDSSIRKVHRSLALKFFP